MSVDRGLAGALGVSVGQVAQAPRPAFAGVDAGTWVDPPGATRPRPILMAALALIAGMIPVALGHGDGADFRAPLGRAAVGGTITSTPLTLCVIPTVYEILDEWRARLGARLRRRRAAPAPSPVAGD